MPLRFLDPHSQGLIQRMGESGPSLTCAPSAIFLFPRAKLETRDPLGFLGLLDPRYVRPYFCVQLQSGLGIVLGKPRSRDWEEGVLT